MQTKAYNGDMNRILAIAVFILALLMALAIMPSRVHAKLWLPENVKPTAPVVAVDEIQKVAPARLLTGSIFAPLERKLTESERQTRIADLQAQIARLQALIATLYGQK